jgi:uncharacterized membrane protein YdfJ with MMPL/SSD domain
MTRCHRASDHGRWRAGPLIGNHQLSDQILADLAKAEESTLPTVAVLLIWTFGGVIAALPSMLVAVLTIVWTLSLLRAINGSYDISNFCLNATTMMGLGCVIGLGDCRSRGVVPSIATRPINSGIF